MPDDTRHDTRPLHAGTDTPTPTAGRWSPSALQWSAARAARETGAARSTILAALQSGRLAGSKDDGGAWQITPQDLAAAGFNPGKPSPPDPVPEREDRDHDDAARLRVELAEVRAESRVLTVKLEAERRILEAVERERDLYRRMLEQGKPSQTRPESTQTVATPEPDPTPTPDPVRPPRANVGRFRRAVNVIRYG